MKIIYVIEVVFNVFDDKQQKAVGILFMPYSQNKFK